MRVRMCVSVHVCVCVCGGQRQRRNNVKGETIDLWYLQNAGNRFKLSSGTDEAI